MNFGGSRLFEGFMEYGFYPTTLKCESVNVKLQHVVNDMNTFTTQQNVTLMNLNTNF